MISPTKPVAAIDVVSDVACPWCYLGKRRLAAAIGLVPEIDVAVAWRPYRLDPTIPPEGMDRKDYIVGKFGSLDALDAAHARLEALGRVEGIDYRFDRMTRAADTTDAHRLVRWAADASLQEPMVERLFRACFSDGDDIGNRAVLAALAGDIGMSSVEVARRLATDEDRAAILDEIDQAYRIGVTGVPTFILARRHGLVGAQPAETIAAAIRRVAAETETSPPL